MSSPVQTRAASAEQELLAIVRELLRQLGSGDAAEKTTIESSLDADLGLGSLERVELLMRVEKAFGVRLPDDVAQRAERLSDWLVALTDEPRLDEAGRGRYPIVQPDRPAPPPFPDARSFVEVLRRRADADPERVQIHLFEEDRGEDISYGRLYRCASDVAAGLIARGLKPGETVAIMLPTCADFFYSFFGVALAGGVAVPIYPPARPKQVEQYVRRQLQILRNAEVRFLISFEQAKPVAEVMRAGLPSLIDVTSVAELAAGGAARVGSLPDAAETFFIQYTSGSTGNPKGVTLSHANVLANVQGIGDCVKARPDDIVVSWLPLYHDMGLIGSWLFSLYHAFPITVLSPLDFLSRPERWLWAMSDSGGTLCPAPNFSYELCTSKIELASIEGVDLSPWRIAINAGEPVIPETLRAFSRRFADFGFRPTSWVPCYGLAESSVALTFPPIDREPVVDAIRRERYETEGVAAPAAPGSEYQLQFVANGVALPGHEVRVVDDAGNVLPDRRRGRVLFRGPSKTEGYFRNPEATRGAIDAEGWMDSGDLGYTADGELYITGRLKDCIIKGGHNIIPQDVERAAAEVAGVRIGCIAAFGLRNESSGTERLVVVVETRVRDADQRSRIRSEVTATVSKKVGMPPDVVELVPPHAVPKTSSGKIRRNETRELYRSGKLGKQQAGSPAVQVARLWAANLGGWLERKASALGGRARRAAEIGLDAVAAVPCGLLARLIPHAGWRTFWTRLGVRGAGGSAARVEGPVPSAPAVVLANRLGDADAAALLAAVEGPVTIVDEGVVDALAFPLDFLLEALLDPPQPAALADGVAHELQAGRTVIGLAESPAGETPARCRFRIEYFEAAAETGVPVTPARLEADAVRFAEAVRIEDPAADRDALRAALAAAARGSASP